MIVCFLPSKTSPQCASSCRLIALTRADNTIKRLGDTLQGFASQCLVIEKAMKRDASYFQNVALKINCKLGGVSTSSRFYG